MPEPSSLSEEIAANIEDVKALLEDNRKLSVAYLSRRLRDLEESTEARFKRIEKIVRELRVRLDKAAEVVKTMQNGKGKDGPT